MDKQITVYLYNGILFGNENKWTTDEFNNIDEAKIIMLNKNSRTYKSKCCTVPFYDILEKQKQQMVTESISACFRCAVQVGLIYMGKKERFEITEMFYTLITVEITQLCISVKTHQIAHLKWACIIVCINDSSVKLTS